MLLKSQICCILLAFLTVLSFDPLGAQERERRQDEEIQKLKEKVAALEKMIEAMKSEQSEEPDALEQELAAELGVSQPASNPPSGQVLGSRSGSLQNMNPNIGLIGNFKGTKVLERQNEDDGFTFTEAELSFQMVIDPFARADAFVAVLPAEETVELEEAYITLLALPGSLQGRLGIFRPPFGKLNLAHPPETPFADQIPRVLHNFFGEEGLAETGVSMSALIPNRWDVFLELNVGAFDGDNEVSFNGDESSDLLFFGHMKSFFDLNENASIELGLSGLSGKNDPAGDLRTNLFGVDFICRWKPLRLSRSKSFALQTEFLFSNREERVRDINSWGMFSYLEYQLGRRWFLGGRLDYSEFPTSSQDREIAYSGMLTYWPSEFQTIRFQYRHLNRNFGANDNTIFLQWVFITGAHGAHAF